MAKRQRPRATPRSGSGRPSRPGTRPASGPPRAGSLSASEEARAAEIEAQIVAREQLAESERGRARDRRRTEERLRDEVLPRTRTGSLLAIRGEQEYAYVVRDVRRILGVGGSLVGVLAVLFILIEVLGVIKI
jgi:hypothetical protein